MKAMTSRERMLSAIRREPVDYVPLTANFNPLRPIQRVDYAWQFPWEQGAPQEDRIAYCTNVLGIDMCAQASLRACYPDPEVTSRVWAEDGTLHKVYHTPSGDVQASIRFDARWPHGLDIPLSSAFNVAHYVEPWITSEADLDCMRHILRPPEREADVAVLRKRCEEARALSATYGVATYANCIYGLTTAHKTFGAEDLCLMTIEKPELVEGYLDLGHRINMRHMEIATEAGIDIVRRDGFYETCDFYSPAMLERFLAKILRAEADVVHANGSVICYTIHTGIMPMLDYLQGLDLDSVIYIDTAFQGVDLAEIRNKLGHGKSFWTGPSNTYHLWSEDPTPVREAVREVFDVFGKRGLVLCPCPSSHAIMPWENTLAMVDEWKRLR